MSIRVALGADHAGYELKSALLLWLKDQGYDMLDVGAFSLDPQDDYPDFSQAVAQAVSSGQAKQGILVCGSGVGAVIAANKVPGARAGICHDTYSAGQGVEHDDMNVLCIGARIVVEELAKELVAAFAGAHFSGEERHQRRLGKVLALEAEMGNGPSTGSG